MCLDLPYNFLKNLINIILKKIINIKVCRKNKIVKNRDHRLSSLKSLAMNSLTNEVKRETNIIPRIQMKRFLKNQILTLNYSNNLLRIIYNLMLPKKSLSKTPCIQWPLSNLLKIVIVYNLLRNNRMTSSPTTSLTTSLAIPILN